MEVREVMAIWENVTGNCGDGWISVQGLVFWYLIKMPIGDRRSTNDYIDIVM